MSPSRDSDQVEENCESEQPLNITSSAQGLGVCSHFSQCITFLCSLESLSRLFLVVPPLPEKSFAWEYHPLVLSLIVPCQLTFYSLGTGPSSGAYFSFVGIHLYVI